MAPDDEKRRVVKLIIDTDPGIDDAYAIALAMHTMRDEVEVIGVTTTFGNVRRDDATRNAKTLVNACATTATMKKKIPVVDGSRIPLVRLETTDVEGRRARDAADSDVFVADFVHGSDGFGNVREEYERVFRREKNGCGDGGESYAYDEALEAADFIAETCAKHPGEVTVLALASLTNVALTFRRHPECLRNMSELVVLGGAYGVNGNVNPAAEANILGDPEAADEVFCSFERTYVVGLDVTMRLTLKGSDIEQLAKPSGADTSDPVVQDGVRKFLHDATQFYKAYHADVAGFDGIYMHDPTALLLVSPELRKLFTFKRAAVRVVTQGITRGQTVMDTHAKWPSPNEWSSAPKSNVAMDVDVDAVLRQFFLRLAIRPSER